MPPAAVPRGSRLLSDDRLARRAQAGDAQAFEAIYQRYHQDLYRFCLAMVGNQADAQEALQETMVKVLRSLPGETRHIYLKPWLYRIARNQAIETIRRRRDSAEIDSEQLVAISQVSDTAETRERLRKLMADLEELPERQRAALVMRELAGLGFAEIGESFDTSAAVARQTVYEARLSLRQMEEGREMSCAAVMRELSDGDGRVIRKRGVRAHLRNCSACRAFEESIAGRHRDFAAVAPLPAAVSAGLLHGILTGHASAATGPGAAAASAGAAGGATGGGLGAGGVAGTVGAGKVVAASAVAKVVATVAVVTAVGVSAADRAGIVHVGLPGSGHAITKPSSTPAGPARSLTRPAPAAPRRKPSVQAPTINPAAAARLAESMEGVRRHGHSGQATRGGAMATAPHGSQGRTRAHSESAGTPSSSHRHQASAHAHGGNHAGGRGHGHSAAHPHQHPAPHPHPAPSPNGGNQQTGQSGASHTTPSSAGSVPARSPQQPAPVQLPGGEAETTAPQP